MLHLDPNQGGSTGRIQVDGLTSNRHSIGGFPLRWCQVRVVSPNKDSRQIVGLEFLKNSLFTTVYCSLIPAGNVKISLLQNHRICLSHQHGQGIRVEVTSALEHTSLGAAVKRKYGGMNPDGGLEMGECVANLIIHDDPFAITGWLLGPVDIPPVSRPAEHATKQAASRPTFNQPCAILPPSDKEDALAQRE